MRNLGAIILLLGVMACQQPEPSPMMLFEQVSFEQVPGWKEGKHQNALQAFIHSCKKFAELPDHYSLTKEYGVPAGTVRDWRNVCNDAQVRELGDARQWFETSFTPFRGSDPVQSEGLFTGYYEIELEGSKERTEEFRYPVYKRPPNLQRYKNAPFFSRGEIEDGALRGQKLELLYVSDPVELFFLHIQGSGRVRLPDGTVVRVGYDGKNGHAYHSIGAHLVDQGVFEMEEVTAHKIKDWLYRHPQQMQDVMNHNASYVFFRIIEEGGILGAQEVPLTPEHSLAVDKDYIPYGLPIWLDTNLPDTGKVFRRLLVAQDTGGAIKGPVRGDIFFGHGKQAAHLAGIMKQPGTLYVLLPSPVAVRMP